MVLAALAVLALVLNGAVAAFGFRAMERQTRAFIEHLQKTDRLGGQPVDMARAQAEALLAKERQIVAEREFALEQQKAVFAARKNGRAATIDPHG
ncbi:MAG TPA: hypothetical protein VD948_02850 [Rhodothermales bacterium]|nr:hypothetical protein [Rhodothermales bacterium]